MYFDDWFNLGKKASQLSTDAEKCISNDSQVLDKIFECNTLNTSIDAFEKTTCPDVLISQYRIFGGCGKVIITKLNF